MTQPIDVAFVDVVARTKGLREEIKDIADEDAKKLQKSFDDASKNINKDFDNMAETADKSFTKITDKSKTTSKKVTDDFTHVFDEIDRHFSKGRDRITGIFSSIGDEADLAERRIRTRFFNAVERGFLRLRGVAGDFARNVGQLLSSAFGLLSSHPFAALIIALIPPIIALVAALKDLVGVVALLPAGLAVLAAIIAPLIIAFQNFGGAVSLLAQGTPKTKEELDKLNEALGKLAPSARVVAREIAGLVPILKDIQVQVQQAFFQPLQGLFPKLAAVLAGPVKNGLTTVASALGNLAARFLNFFSSAQSVALIDKVFQSTARILNALAGPVTDFLAAMANSVVAALPFVERLGAAFGRFLDKFASFINEGIASGAFDQFIEDAFTITKELLSLGKALFGFLGTLFAGTEQSGHDLIQTLTDLFNKLNDFLKTAEGQDALRELVLLVKAFGFALMTTFTVMVSAQQQFSSFLKALEVIGRGFFALIKAIGSFFADLPKKIGNFVARIPEAIGTALTNGFNLLFTALGVAVGVGLFVIQDLPNRIGQFLSSIPQRIRDSLAQAGPAFGDTLQQMMDRGLEILRTGIDNIIAFLKSVPDRIIALGPALLDAGVNLIKSFMNGFRTAGNFIGDVAGDIVNGIKGFINKAIDRINDGIRIIERAIDRANAAFGIAGLFIPSTHLGRIPHLAHGGVVAARPGGILANVGEGGEDEVVSPLSKLKSMIAEVGGGITFGPGSIVVNLGGSLPSTSEARSTGQAIGQGILSILERTQIQAAVRAM